MPPASKDASGPNRCPTRACRPYTRSPASVTVSRTSTVYLLHFDRPIGAGGPHGFAQHYIGSTSDLPARLEDHRAGRGARLMEVIAGAGVSFVVARTWPGGRTLERRLKNRKEAPRLCPICRADSHKPGGHQSRTNDLAQHPTRPDTPFQEVPVTSPPYTSHHDPRFFVIDEASQLIDTLETHIPIAPDFPGELYSSWAAAWDGVIADPADPSARQRMLFYARARGPEGRQDLAAREALWRRVQSPVWYRTASPWMVMRAVRETRAFADRNPHAAGGLQALRTHLPANPALSAEVLQHCPGSLAAREIRQLLHAPAAEDATAISQLVSPSFPALQGPAGVSPAAAGPARTGTPSAIAIPPPVMSPRHAAPEVA